MTVFSSTAVLFVFLGDVLLFISWSLWAIFFLIFIKLLFSFLFYWRLWFSFPSKLSFKLFLRISLKIRWFRICLKTTAMFLRWKLLFKYLRLLRLIGFISFLIILFLEVIIFKYLVSTHNFMKDIFSLFIRYWKRGSSFLSGWYCKAISRNAFLISFLFAPLLIPRTS